MYGCIVTTALPCATRPHVLAPTGTYASETVSKLQLNVNAADLAPIQAAVQAVDPEQAFTVPFESTCKLSAEHGAHAMREPKCDSLKSRYTDYVRDNASGPRPSVLQFTMRRGVPFRDMLIGNDGKKGEGLSVAHTLAAIQAFLPYLQRMHTAELGHGDLKLDNVLYFPADKRLRLIDFDFMFSYGLHVPVVAHAPGEPDWRARFELLTGSAAIPILRQPAYDALTVCESFYFPPENIMLARLFSITDEQVRETYKTLTHYVGKAWSDALEFEFMPKMYDAQAVSIETFALNYQAHVRDWFAPDKHVVFQLGCMLLEVKAALKLRDALEDALMDLIFNMTHPMHKTRITLAEAAKKFGELTARFTGV